ncbi:MAG: hypothetical protein IPP61_12970 [Cytophagaceae bacterium]|nr:hypothetical protein [Cytophagaceae bacterium]MBL0303220.1 hypothetical protein [Cytophagaceae bacterium]MBL0326070.1 hypothetical protein [Cytophagaceae bacterium]
MISIAFILISLLSLSGLYFGAGRDLRLLLFFVIWQLFAGTLAYLKVFEKTPLLFPLLMAGTIAVTIFSLKRIGKQKLNPNILLSIHVLRIPVELILFQLFLQNKIPNLMTFKGWNFDILIGLSALAILFYQFISKRKIKPQFFLIWNITGIVFLSIIVTLAILSAPLPVQQFAFDQPNIAVLEFPYCWLPTCVVPIVLISHILLLKKTIDPASIQSTPNLP